MKLSRIVSILAIAILFPTTHPARSIGNLSSTSTLLKSPDSNISADRPKRIAQDYTPPTPQQVQTIAQKITVRVTSINHGGSGVLVAHKGNTYLVLTNKHVTGRDTQFQIQTPDGQKHSAKLVPNTKIDPKYDISLLQFTSTQKYDLADLDTQSPLDLSQSDPRLIYSVGYPYDSTKMRISIGTVTQLSDVPLEDGTQIGYKINKNSPAIKQGMSGGPIVDGRGVLLGINTIGSQPILPNYTYFDGSKPTAKRTAAYRQANWGIPIYNLLTQLDANILYDYKNFPTVQRQVTPTGYMAKLNRETRQQTVRIETATAGNGSGVIVAKQGNTYYVLTAKHVLETPATKTQPKQRHPGVKIITYDQDSYQIEPSNIKLAKGLDLAIVKFTSSINYPVARLGKYSPTQNATVFVAGYPGRDKIDSPLWQWQLNPGQIEEKEQGKLEAQDNKSLLNGYDLIYTSISYGGMSGGPVFDTEGRVIGIHGKAEGDRGLILGKSLGISAQTFIGLRDKLQVPNLLGTSINQPRDLNPTDRDTVIAVRDNIAKPQNESNGRQWLQYGNQLYRIGKYTDAVVAFDNAIAKGDEYQLLGNYGKALALVGANKPRPSLAAIATAISLVRRLPPKQQPNYYYLWRLQSGLFIVLKDNDNALKSINTAIELEPEDLTLLNQKALILTLTKQDREAIAIYDLIISKQPEAYAYINRGLAKYQSGQIAAAIVDYNLAISINPNSDKAYNDRGLAKARSGQKQAAIIDYNLAIAINPKSNQAYSNRGLAKYQLGQYSAAIVDYTVAIAINPIDNYAYVNRCQAKTELGQHSAAIIDCNLAIEIDPSDSKAYNNRGRAKTELGQYSAAIADFNLAIKLDDRYDVAYYNRGLIKSKLGQYQAAISDYDLAIKFDPKFASAYIARGIANSQLGQYQLAIIDYDRVIKFDPTATDAYVSRCGVNSMLGRYQAAMIDCDRAIVLKPRNSEAYFFRGLVKSHLTQYLAAIIDFDQAIAIDLNYAPAYMGRGTLKAILGNKSGAILDLTKAADLFRQQKQMLQYDMVTKEILRMRGENKL